MKVKQKLKTNRYKIKNQKADFAEVPKTFIEHIYELRSRLIYIVGSILIFSTLAYFVQQHIVNFLLRPSKGQQFIYTSPIGGVNFLFTVCIYVGIAASTPIIIYQILGFFRPLVKNQTRTSLIHYSYLSALLAAAGFCFGYYLGLPVALHFLSHQFANNQIHALFTIQEYMSFMTIYLLGSMLLFQLPIILFFINRIKPLTPRKLFSAERYVIVGAFILAMIMAPTPNILNQLILVVPIIAMYNLSILAVGIINRRERKQKDIRKAAENTYYRSSVALSDVAVASSNEPKPVSSFARPNTTRRPNRPPLMIMDIRPPLRY